MRDGLRRLSDHQSLRQERALSAIEQPVYATARKLFESEDPLERAVVHALTQLSTRPLKEFLKGSKRILAEEIAVSIEVNPKHPGAVSVLPPIEDPTDRRIWDWIQDDPMITDGELAARAGLSRQAVNARRRSLAKMGYPVRGVSRQTR